MQLFSFFTKWKKSKKEINGKVLVDQLEKKGYFKYTQKDKIDELKRANAEHLNKYQNLTAIYEENNPYHANDFRQYPLDGEDLFEPNGIIDKLEEMKPLFKKMNFKLSISHHIEEWDTLNELHNHSITLNDKNYILFKDFKGSGWEEAAQRFADMLNDQLEIQGKDERIYLRCGGNDGSCVFFTEEQFNLLNPIFTGSMDRPLRVTDWCKVMQINPDWM